MVRWRLFRGHGRPRTAPLRLALVIACVLVVALLAQQVATHGPVTRFDAQVTQWWVAHRQPGLTRAMLFVSAAHRNAMLLAASVVLVIALGAPARRRSLRTLAVVPIAMVLNGGLKLVFGRPRPQLDPLVHLTTLSFPSGHAVASTVFYGACCALVFERTRSRGVRALACGLAVLMVLLVTFSRVYLAAHYLSDVVAGIAVGIACLAILGSQGRPAGADPTS
jgi:membrane-associated phospholipid phosphatase